ncbi:MAG: hypothetical protein WCL60_05245 [Methylococcales bacterium]
MFEGLFALIIIFVAYVVYQAVNEHQEVPKVEEPQSKAKESVQNLIVPQPVTESVKPAKKPSTIKPTPLKKSIPKVDVSKETNKTNAKKGLLNPITGEVATTYNNYRFTKRWIKEALVTEGLLEKVYKNNELNADTEADIKAALAKLEVIDKYKPS